MVLMGNKDYLVTIVTNRHKRTCMTVKLTYCGGSFVDEQGHHIGGGVWAKGRHPLVRYFCDLNVLNIVETTQQW